MPIVVPLQPEPLRHQIMYQFHNHPMAGHTGFDKMYAQLRRRYTWKGMSSDVKTWTTNCPSCAKANAHKMHKKGVMQLWSHSGLYEVIQIDFTGPYPRSVYGNSMCLTIIDRFTHHVTFVPTQDGTAESTALALWNHVFCVHGCPRVILSDNGAPFRSELVRRLHDLLGVRQVFTTPYHPRTNGMAERVHRYLKATLRIMITKRSGI